MSGSSFSGRVIVMTGGGSGIGAAAARRFASLGARVVVVDIVEDRAQEVTREITEAGGEAIASVADVGSAAAWAELAAMVSADFDGVDVVCNNAFTVDVRPAHEMAEESWERQIAVDLSAVYHSVRAFLPQLRATGGNIVNTSSVHALLGFPNHPAYAAAKGGLVALTRQLAIDYGPEVRVNAVLPGGVRTRAWDGLSRADIAATEARTAARRLGRPEEVAAAITFLASNDASYITGATLVVDGGLTAMGVA